MLRTVVAAAATPVSLVEAKQQLYVDHSDDDVLITGMIETATLQAQSFTQRLFVTQTVEWVLPGFCPCIKLPVAPVAKEGIVSIKYFDWATQTQMELDAAKYVAQACGPTLKVFPAFGMTWPLVFAHSAEPVVIQFTAGEAVKDVPANVKTAILMHVAHFYRNRESVVVGQPGQTVEVPQGAQSLLMSEVW